MPPLPAPLADALWSAIEARRRLAEPAPLPPAVATAETEAAHRVAVVAWQARLAHEAVGLLLLTGALGGPLWWWAARVIWHAARLHLRATR
jgi:hypothetical protein